MAKESNGGAIGGIDPKELAKSLKIKQLGYLLEKMNAGKDLTVTEQKRLSDFIDSELGEMSGNQERFENANAVAEHYEIGKATVSLAVTRGRIMRNEDGTFDKAITDAYWCDKLGKRKKPIKGSPAGGSGPVEVDPSCTIAGQIEEQRLRKMKAEAEAKEILARRMRKQLFSVEDIQREWIGRATAYREGLTNFARRLPPLLVNRTQNEIAALLKDEADNLLLDILRQGKYTPNA